MRFIFKFEGGVEVVGELEEEVSSKLAEAAPFTSTANRWGDEVYFELPVNLNIKGSKVVMEEGEIAYWPQGNALCIFFGPTPVSKAGEPRAYSPVKPLGKVVKGLEELRRVRDGEEVEVRAED